MGFEKTDDDRKSSVEGFETDVIDLEGGSEEIFAVKAPRRSSRKEPRFSIKRDRLGRKETNSDDSPDSEDKMVAPVRPVRLSGSGAVHIQKPVMKEGSDFAYLFTDQDEDQNDRHMDRDKASRLDGLAYNEQTDGDVDQYADLFEQTRQPAAGPVRKEPGTDGVRPEEKESAQAAEAQKAAVPEPAPRAVPEENSEGPKRRAMFNRHTRSSERKEGGYDGASGGDGYPAPGTGRDERDRGRDRYDRYYEDERGRGYDRERDRYYERDYDSRRGDYDGYDRRYEEDEADYRRYGYYDRYRREPEPYEAEPVYPPGSYPVMPGMYPSVMGGYQPIYYAPAPIVPVQGGQPVQYVQGTVYGMPVQGVPVTGMPVQGVPVQNIAVPVPGYNYTYDAAQQAQNAAGDAAPAETASPETESAAAENDRKAPQSAGSTGARSGSSRFNRHGSHEKAAEAPSYNTAKPQETSYAPADVRNGGAGEEDYAVPSEDSIPHFRPRTRFGSAPANAAGQEQQAAANEPAAQKDEESKPAESRFRRRHS